MNQVTENTLAQRFEIKVAEHIAFIDYRRENGVVSLTHTYVPPELNGQGIGSALTRGALDLLRAQGEKIVPLCSFIIAFIKRHPEYRTLLVSQP